MTATGRYIRSIVENDDNSGGHPDANEGASLLLRLISPTAGVSFNDLLSRTGWSESYLNSVLGELLSRQFIWLDNEKYKLTGLGEKAKYAVAM